MFMIYLKSQNKKYGENEVTDDKKSDKVVFPLHHLPSSIRAYECQMLYTFI